jgi:hypothetical protein
MPPKIDDTTVALLNRLLGGRSPEIPTVKSLGNSENKFIRVDLPAAASAQYSFSLWFYEDREREISAQPLQQNDDHDYFWSRSFELAEFVGSEGDLVKAFCSELEVLLTHETRIVQRKGLLFWHFVCEYRDREKWKSVGSNSAFRFGNFKPPPIDGKRHVYQSGPVATVAL